MKIYELLRSFEEQSDFKCNVECKHDGRLCPYEHALSYAGHGADVYYALQRAGIKLSEEDYAKLDELQEEYSELLTRCDELRAAR